MHELAPKLGESASASYVVGLLHAIGKVIIHSYILDHTSGTTKFKSYKTGLTVEDEVDILGFNRSEVAAALLKRWHFPESIYIPIQYQESPLEAPNYRQLTCLLALSNNAALTINKSRNKDYRIIHNSELISITGLSVEEIDETAKDSDSAVALINAAGTA